MEGRAGKDKQLERKHKVIVIIALIFLCLLGSVWYVKALGTFTVELTANTANLGSVTLDWSEYDYINKNFKVYKSSDNGSSWETVGVDYKLVDRVRVLQIYPRLGDNLKTWMETAVYDESGNLTTYGKGIIKVDKCTINQFNANPDGYLGTGGNWNYDVIVFGFWDGNNAYSASLGEGTIDLTTTSRGKVEKFIKAGKGVLFGHDVVVGYNPQYRTNYNWLADRYLGVNSSAAINSGSSRYTYIKIHKKGLFSSYPWYLGDEGTVIGPIPKTHDWDQLVTTGKIFVTGVNADGSNVAIHANSAGALYLVVNNNVAMIMTGHSDGASSNAENKLLANTLFYLNQLLFNTWTTNDPSAQDYAAPNSTSVEWLNGKANLSATDNGTPYYYYVESYSKDDTTTAGLLARSETKGVVVTTGVVGYRYIFNDSSSGTVTKTNSSYVAGSELDIDGTKNYLHVAAIDGAGNLGPTTTVRVLSRQIVQVRYENADGTFTEYTNEYDEYHKIGDVVEWSRPADNTYKAASEISYAVEGDTTTQVTVYRKQFKLSLSIGTGVSSVSGEGTYRVGQSVTIDAVVKEGYTWKDWTGTYNVTDKEYVFNMPSSEVTMKANAEDITPPVVTLEQNPTVWTKGDVILTVTASDKGSGLDSKPYSWNNGNTWVEAETSTVGKNGTYTVLARDKAGNIGSASITVTNIDKLPPVINGLEAFVGLGEIDRNEGVKTVEVRITDLSNNDYGASGVKGGELIIENSDNGLIKTWSIGSDGVVSVDITNKDTKELSELFYGNFRITVNAEDNVGNTSKKEFNTTEFTLDSELVHADNYKSSLFIRGETGLFIFYAGGYPDEIRVYFPTDAGLNKDYSKVFYYKKQNAIEVGMIPFYVPLEAIKGDYTIYVESYKNGKLLQTKSQAFEIGLETVLNELRTEINK